MPASRVGVSPFSQKILEHSGIPPVCGEMKGGMAKTVVGVDQCSLVYSLGKRLEIVSGNGSVKIFVNRVDHLLTKVFGKDFPSVQAFVFSLEQAGQFSRTG